MQSSPTARTIFPVVFVLAGVKLEWKLKEKEAPTRSRRKPWTQNAQCHAQIMRVSVYGTTRRDVPVQSTAAM